MTGKITVKVIPVEGKERTIEVKTTGAKLKDVLKEAGVDSKLNFEVRGRPVVDLDTFVEEGAIIKVTEKVRGS